MITKKGDALRLARSRARSTGKHLAVISVETDDMTGREYIIAPESYCDSGEGEAFDAKLVALVAPNGDWEWVS